MWKNPGRVSKKGDVVMWSSRGVAAEGVADASKHQRVKNSPVHSDSILFLAAQGFGFGDSRQGWWKCSKKDTQLIERVEET